MMVQRSSPFVLLGLAVLSMGCSQPDRDSAEGPATEPLSEQPVPVPHDSDLAVHMGEHFWQMAAAHDAAISGDLGGLKIATGWLAEHDPPADLPAGSDPFVEALKNQSAAVSQAVDLATGTMALGDLAATCGSCHLAFETELPTVLDEDIEGGGVDLSQQMSAHIRGADLLWEGLIAPSEQAWAAGTEVLAQVEIVPETVAAGPAEIGIVRDLLGRVAEVAQAGADAQPHERPIIYGQLLATCGHCHRALGRGFEPPN
ncbi:MAG: hypothetical protein ACR2QM_09745 [Longimicrobiales bacterium]